MGARMVKMLGAVILGPFLCVVGFTALTVCLVVTALPQLPEWSRQPVLDWLIGRPQPEVAETGRAYDAAYPIDRDGFEGVPSFACLLPPTRGYLTDGFGTLRTGNWLHRGLDFGTYFQPVPVRTPFGGKVVFSGWNGPYGQLVVIENADHQVLLAHHSRLMVPAGNLVSAGDVIAESGTTGNSTGFHVHMELRRWNGSSWVNLDPSSSFLPGQSTLCKWEALSAP